MRVVALVIAAILGLIGAFLLLGSLVSGELGPVELVVALIPIGIAVMLVRAGKRNTTNAPAKGCPDCRTRVPHDARVCRHCGYEFWSRERDSTARAPRQ